MSGARQDTQCAEALQLARTAFRSNEFLLYGPPVIPADFESTLALWPQGIDISGGNALNSDPAIFDKLPMTGERAGRSVYWQTKSASGVRLVMKERDVGWRGDMYTLYALKDTIGQQELLADASLTTPSQRFAPLVEDSWRPPLVFQQRRNGQTWIVDVGEPYDFLGDWRVYAQGPEGVTLRCTVHFRPDVKQAVTLLPPPVRRLARLLDRTIGPGNDEGTLQPTQRLRIDVSHTWANVALRPWVSLTPYNSRQQVDAGLLAWSHTGASYARVYQQIEQQYPAAAQSLASYYRTALRLPAAESQALATSELDAAFRSNFVLPNQ